MPACFGHPSRDALHDARTASGRAPVKTAGGATMPVMPSISVTTAAALAGVDRRTVRRWLGEGDVSLVELLRIAGLELDAAEVEAVLLADTGDAEGCADLALILSTHGHHSRAIEWIQRAADKGHADAMHWLARAYFDGQGVPKDQYLGLMWLAKAASLGHPISQAQTSALLALR
jgi:TPR repeat protein